MVAKGLTETETYINVFGIQSNNMLNNAILILDDNYPDFLVLVEQLEEFGFSSSNFYNCASLEELESAAVANFAPTFIIADLSLPDSISGLDTYLHVQKLFPTIPIVVIAGVDNPGLAMKCLQAGAQNFLVKGSFTPDQLIRYINYATERNRLKQELEKLKEDYQKIFDENPLPMFVVSVSTFEFIAVNKMAIKKYGYSENEFENLRLGDLEAGSTRASASITSALSTRPSLPNRLHLTKSGDILYVELTTTNIVYTGIRSFLITVNDVTEKVLAEEEEKKAKQRLEAIFNRTQDAILLTNNDSRYVQVNQAACQMLGYTEEELLNLHSGDVLISDKTGSFDKAEFTESGIGIAELKRKNGDILICHYNVTDNILPGLHLAIITDVTEREVARRKLDEQRKNTEKILESITDCFFMVDNNWVVTYWNKAAEKILKKRRENIIGKNLWSVYKSAKKMTLYGEFNRAMSEQVPVHVEDYFYGMDLWFDTSAYPSPEGLAIYFRDITDQKKRSLELLQAKNNQSALIDSSADLIWSLDKNMKLVSFNESYKKELASYGDRQIAEGEQLPIPELPDDEFIRWADYYERGLHGESFIVDEIIRDRQGNISKYCEVSFRPIYNVDSGEVIGLACYSHDITHRIHQQALIEQQNSRLRANEEHLQKVTSELEKVLNSSLDMICSFDKDGKFLQVSAASKYILGYTPQEMIGRPLTDFIHPSVLQRAKKEIIEIRSGVAKTNFEGLNIHKNGHTVPTTWSARWDAQEQILFAVGRDASAIKEAEKLKQEAEQRFTALVNKGADMVAILDHSANYKYISPNTEDILGYSVDFLVTQNALTHIHPDDLEMAVGELTRIMDTDEIKIHAFRYKHANGTYKWLETVATNAFDNPAINGIILNTRDITSRKKIETERELMIKELLKSNADLKQFSFITSHNLRAPLSNIKGILNIVDYKSLDDYNKQMMEMLQVSASQLGQTIDDLIKILIIKNNVNVEISTVDLQESFGLVNNIYLNALNDVCASCATSFNVKTICFNKTYFESILVNLMSNAIKYRSHKRSLQIGISSERNEDGDTILKFADNGLGIDLDLHKGKVFGLYQRFHDNTEGHGLGLFIINSQIVALGGNIEVESEVGKGTTFTITFKNQPGNRLLD